MATLVLTAVGAVFGGPMTCLVLEDDRMGFLTSDPVHEPVSIVHR